MFIFLKHSLFQTMFFSVAIAAPIQEPSSSHLLNRLGCTGYCNVSACPYSSIGSTIITKHVDSHFFELDNSYLYKATARGFNKRFFEVQKVSFCRYTPHFFKSDKNNGTVICEVQNSESIVPQGIYNCHINNGFNKHTGKQEIIEYSAEVRVFYGLGDDSDTKSLDRVPTTYAIGGTVSEILTVLTQHNCPIMKDFTDFKCNSINSLYSTKNKYNFADTDEIVYGGRDHARTIFHMSGI